MRKVMYFMGGIVADFTIPDDRFEEFTKNIDWEIRHEEGELDKARGVLERFTRNAPADGAGPVETLAACFVWNFFNTNPDDERFIKGDIVIVDLQGDGSTIEYASAADIQMAPEN